MFLEQYDGAPSSRDRLDQYLGKATKRFGTEPMRRRVPLRAKVVAALEELPRRHSILFPASEGGRVNIDNFRSREWCRLARRPASSTGVSTT